VPAVNCNHYFASEVGHELAIGRPFAATYYDTTDGRVFSLRSSAEGLDVSEIAKRLGGGGHAKASGFKVSFKEASTYEITS
jgi:nanoRNase/pAp phosphatase (c-di-AMP/oligoRNAs hydrolase)